MASPLQAVQLAQHLPLVRYGRVHSFPGVLLEPSLESPAETFAALAGTHVERLEAFEPQIHGRVLPGLCEQAIEESHHVWAGRIAWGVHLGALLRSDECGHGLRLRHGETIAILQIVELGQHENRNLQGSLAGRGEPRVKDFVAAKEGNREFAGGGDVHGHQRPPLSISTFQYAIDDAGVVASSSARSMRAAATKSDPRWPLPIRSTSFARASRRSANAKTSDLRADSGRIC